MDKGFIRKLVNDVEKIEQDSINLFKVVPLRPTERISRDDEDKEDIVVLTWCLDEQEEAKSISRDIRRRYEAWYHASLKLVEEYLPYQVKEFKSVYEIMISYVTLNRFANTTESILSEVSNRYKRGFVSIYLNEFANVIDVQANLIRSLLYLPDEEIESTYRCFLTGFPAPYKLRENPNLAFVIMPFDKAFDDIYQLGIKETFHSLGLQCKRSDEIIHTQNVICTSICQPIRAARYVVADITDRNPNVFYELGFTHARSEDQDQANKRVIILTQNMSDLPFDLRTMSIIHYENIGSLRTKLKAALIAFMGQGSKAES
jgi:hypothetical protein